MNWTKEQDARLAALWADGDLSAKDIASVLRKLWDEPLTKNAIIGRVHRLKLKLRRESYHPAKVKLERAQMPKSDIQAKREAGTKQRQALTRVNEPFIPVSTFEPSENVWEGSGVPMDALGHDSCRWPYSEGWRDPATSFCGHPVKAGSSYCQHHHDIAFRPTTKVDRNMGKVTGSLYR